MHLPVLDRDRVQYPADIAILEDFPGEDLLDRYIRDPAEAAPTPLSLAAAGLTGMICSTVGSCARTERKFE